MNTYEKIYAVVKSVPYGKVITYGQIATLIGNVRLSRVVGYALHANPRPDEIPCYRVVNKDGYVTPSFAFGGREAQIAKLQSEGISVSSDGRVDLRRYGILSANGGIPYFFDGAL